MTIYIPSLIAAALSLLGNVFINCKRRAGFLVWTAGNAAWIAVERLSVGSWAEMNWLRVGMFAVYGGLNLWGWMMWGNQDFTGSNGRI